MRILFLSHYFPPEVNAPASRTWEHCRQWVEHGHQVTVITCAPNHPRGKVYPGYRNRLFQRERRNGIDVVRVWTYLTANEGFLKRTLNYLSFMVSSVLAALFVGRADVVISTSPQFFNGLAGYFAAALKRASWVLEIRDLWPESIMAVGAIKNRRIIRFLERLEMFAYQKADAIVPVTDSFKEYMVGKGIRDEKITVIKNGVDLDFYQSGTVVDEIRRELGLDGKFVAAYFGTHGMAHHLETMLEAAQILKTVPDIAFLMVGDGAERARLEAMKDDLDLKNVLMLEQQPKERMPSLWKACDVSIVILRKSELFKTVIPSKIFESMGMGRPIVLGVEGESAEIVKAAAAGVCIEPENARELADGLLMFRREPGLGAVMGASGHAYVAEHFDRKKLAKNFEGLLRKVAAARVARAGRRD